MEPTSQNEVVPRDGLEQVVACIESARSCRYFDVDRARGDAQRGLELLRQLQTPTARHDAKEAELLVLLGSFDRLDGHIESAVVQYHQALKLIANRPASRVACDAWIGLGWAYAQIGDFSRALRYSLQGLKTARAQGVRDGESHALDVLGCVYAMSGDAVEALRHLEQAARIARNGGDRRRLCSVLNNLAMTLLGRDELAPALAAGRESLRIAQEDSLSVAGRLEPRDGDPRTWVRFAVRDTGIGVDADIAATLFRPFVQADDSPARPYGGSGLGLAISRQLVGLMGGAIDFRSEPGKGSTFWFDVPLRPRHGAATAGWPNGVCAAGPLRSP